MSTSRYALLGLCCVTFAFALWPAPKVFRNGSEVLWISPELSILYNTKPTKFIPGYLQGLQRVLGFHDGPRIEPTDLPSRESLLKAAESRVRETLQNSIVPRKFHQRTIPFEPALDAHRTLITTLTLNVVDELKDDHGRNLQSTDGYTLTLERSGYVVINMLSHTGGLRSLQTFTQLFYAHSSDPTAVYTPHAPLQIIDEPVFEHRGINLDISRNSISPEDVKRQIPAMAACKLNRLHLHASDAQSWPLAIPSCSELAFKGAYDESQIWSVEDLEDLQSYGGQHGVQVYLEIDLPGHSTAVGQAFEEHIVAGNMQPWGDWALEPPSGQLRLNSSTTTAFVRNVLNDLLSRVSRHNSLFHIGGDEVNKRVYELDPTVKSSDESVLKPLLQAFVSNASGTVASHGLSPVVWQEMLLDWDLILPPDTIVQAWKEPASLAAIVAKGFRALFGSYTHWYLDCGHGTFLDPNRTNSNSPIRPPYSDWCAPYKSWRQVYSYNPMSDVPDKDQYLVMGGEVSLWGELTDSVTLDGMLWPRAAAAAEVLWSGSGQEANEDATRRLAEFRERLVAQGIAAGMVQMEWCLRNPGCCTL